MMTVQELRDDITGDPEHWMTHFFNFVDDFRCYKKASQVSRFKSAGDKYDYLLASVIEYLCDEMGMIHPKWTRRIGRLKDPWFLSDLRTGIILGLLESPAMYRQRNIFVSKDFLFRV
jgi:hypothetical protein